MSTFLQLTLPGGNTINRLPGSNSAFTNLGSLVGGFLNLAFLIAGFLMFFWLLWGIFEYLISGDNKEHVANARNRIKWALVGFGIVAMAFLVSQFVQVILEPTAIPGGVEKL